MSLIIALIMMGAVNTVTCIPSDHYTEHCVPPTGIPEDNNGNITTPSGLFYKYPIKPLERCCPVCDECVTIGGHCKIRWLPEIYPEFCDFTKIDECRDYSCTCCVKCADDKCSACTETGGNCRKECRSGELEDTTNKCSFYNDGTDGCKCCKQCEATSECTDAYGYCVTDPADCAYGTYASTGCCGGCYCCKPVFEPIPEKVCYDDPRCYCSETGDKIECETGFYGCPNECFEIVTHGGLSQEKLGYACIPKQTGVNRRIDQLALTMNQAIDPQQHQQQPRRHPKQLLD